ncbi:MAG: hypothetical protein V3T33_03355 [Myxococcota bacterium]
MGLCLLAVTQLGCAIGAWRQARKQDSPAAYHRFLRDHPRSWLFSERARAQIDYKKLQRHPSVAGFTRFRERFPKSKLIPEMEPLFEKTAFTEARAAGTPASYATFLERFPDGVLAARATGNATFLKQRGYGGRPAALATFAVEHGASDFAAEARRSADTVLLREKSRFDRVGLLIDIAPGTPEVERLIQAFTKAAKKQYDAAGILLVPIAQLQTDDSAIDHRPALLKIRHSESESRTQLSDGRLSSAAVIAATDVTLQIGPEGAPIWKRNFGVRVNLRDRRPDTSVLFGANGRGYWADFFVPVATWQSNGAVRAPIDFGRKVVAIDAVGDRSVVLFEDGDFQFVELADPTAPEVLVEYDRGAHPKRFQGVQLLGDRIVFFGEDGLEVMRFGAAGPESVGVQGHEKIGSVKAVAAIGEKLLIGGSRGLLVANPEGGEPSRLARQPIRGLAVVGDTVLYSDGESLFLSTVALLRQNRLLSQLRLGRDFGPGRIRVYGRNAIVIGDDGIMLLDMARPHQPRVISQLYNRVTGRVLDAGQIRGRIFLIGDRGLQLLDRAGKQIVQSIATLTAQRMDTMGRHMVIVGGNHLQIVDSTPFTTRHVPSGLAAPSEAVEPAGEPPVEGELDEAPQQPASPGA